MLGYTIIIQSFILQGSYSLERTLEIQTRNITVYGIQYWYFQYNKCLLNSWIAFSTDDLHPGWYLMWLWKCVVWFVLVSVSNKSKIIEKQLFYLHWKALSPKVDLYIFCLPRGSPLKNLSAFRRRGFGFDPWVGKIPWRRRKWQSTPVFLPGKSRGQRSLVGYNPWRHRCQTWPSNYTITYLCYFFCRDLVHGN